MKLIQVHNYYQQAGGEDAVVAAERTLLEARGDVVVPYYKDNEALGVGRWALVKASLQTLWNGATYRKFRKVLQSEKPDVVHCHNTFPLISPSIYWACAKEGVPVVQTLHNYRLLCLNAFLFRQNSSVQCDDLSVKQDLKPNHLKAKGSICELCLTKSFKWPGIRYRCYRGSLAGSLVVALMLFVHKLLGTWSRKVTAYIALTEFQKQKMIEGGLPEAQIFVKPNFIQTTEHTESTENISRRDNKVNGEGSLGNITSDSSAGSVCDNSVGQQGGANGEESSTTNNQQRSTDKKPYCLFVGRLSPEKGCDVLIRAWHYFASNHQLQTPNSATAPQLLIVGDGPERETLESIAIINDQRSTIHFLGRKTKNEVLFLMRHAQCLVFPSLWYETFGLTVFEAGMQETASIVAEPTTTSDLIDDGRTGLLFPMENAAALAEKLGWAFGHPEEMAAMGAAARVTFEEKYSYKINYKIYIRIIKKILNDYKNK